MAANAAVDDNFKRQLRDACCQGQLDQIRELLDTPIGQAFKIESVIDDINGWTALHFIAYHGHSECMRTMTDVRYGITNPNIQDSFGSTPLHLAVSNGHADCVFWLVGAFANCSIVDNRGLTAFECAHDDEIRAAFYGTCNMLYDYRDIIRDACRCGDVDCLRKTLDAHPEFDINDPNICNYMYYQGESALFQSIRCRQLKCIELLISRGADLNMKNLYGETALHIAVDINYIDGIQVLLAAGADGNIVNFNGQTALDLATNDATRDAFKGGGAATKAAAR